MLKHLFFRPEILSRLIFSLSDGKSYFVQATEKQKARRALPEEIIRQLFILSLLHDYKYPEERIHLEWPIQMGRDRKRADIVVLDERGNVFIILEVKVEIDRHSMGQLKSYMTMVGAKYGALISASEMECIEMQSPREVSSVRDIPFFDVSLSSPVDVSHNQISESIFLSNESNVQKDNNSKAGQNNLLQKLIGIEQFKRINKTHANITINGSTLRLPIEDSDSYKTLRRKFLSEGIALNPDIKQSEWFALFRHFLESNPVPEYASTPTTTNVGQVERVVLKAINQGLPGFANGWVSSLHLDRLLKENRLDSIMPRAKRREMMRSIGYDWHPALPKGRSSTIIPMTMDRPVFFLKQDHWALHLNDGKEIMAAYMKAQEPESMVTAR